MTALFYAQHYGKGRRIHRFALTVATGSALLVWLGGMALFAVPDERTTSLDGAGHTSASHAHPVPDGGTESHGEAAMPDGAADKSEAEERKLFLTPGGMYTTEDIIANGRTIPAVKYAGFIATHNMNPHKGERLCPITNTAANPRLSWIVGGKPYTFCCPPCVREFVNRAKTRPATILSPQSYVKK